MEDNHTIWIEKYRPQKLADIVGQDEIVERLSSYVKSGNLPHLLFTGSAGVGKTTAAVTLARELFKDSWQTNFRELNASDERGIDVVRNQIKQFARTTPLGEATPTPSEAAGTEPELRQLHRTYILAPVRDGVVIVDQHAAHERILYDEAIARLRGAQGGSQGLLFPALVDLSRSQFELLLELLPHLQRLGWELAPLSPPTVVIQGVPSGLLVESPAGLLQDVLDGLGEGGATAEDDLLERLANSHACHSAIRAGDVLSQREMRMLVDRLFGTTRPHGDPHGRPTFVRMDLAELHRRFGRTGDEWFSRSTLGSGGFKGCPYSSRAVG